MARIFWDSNIFIYLFEDNGAWSERVVQFRKQMIRRQDQLVTSFLTVGEVLTKPRKANDSILEKAYLNLFTGNAVELAPFALDAAQRYSALRSASKVKPADGIQLACAAAAKIDLFVTNDERLSRLVVPGITFITALDRIPY